MGQQISTEKVLENYDAIQSETETNPLNWISERCRNSVAAWRR